MWVRGVSDPTTSVITLKTGRPAAARRWLTGCSASSSIVRRVQDSAALAVRSASGTTASGRSTGWRSRKKASVSVMRSSAPPMMRSTASPRRRWLRRNGSRRARVRRTRRRARQHRLRPRRAPRPPVSQSPSSRRSAGRRAANAKTSPGSTSWPRPAPRTPHGRGTPPLCNQASTSVRPRSTARARGRRRTGRRRSRMLRAGRGSGWRRPHWPCARRENCARGRRAIEQDDDDWVHCGEANRKPPRFRRTSASHACGSLVTVALGRRLGYRLSGWRAGWRTIEASDHLATPAGTSGSQAPPVRRASRTAVPDTSFSTLPRRGSTS